MRSTNNAFLKLGKGLVNNYSIEVGDIRIFYVVFEFSAHLKIFTMKSWEKIKRGVNYKKTIAS